MCLRVSFKKKYMKICLGIHKVTEERSRIPELDPNPLVRGMDPRIRTKMSRIPNTDA
jgi:hypothetical protein